MGPQKVNDLESCVELEEEEEIKLLEDGRAGNLIYFVSWYFFRGKWLWNIILSFCFVFVAFSTWFSYFCLRDIYYDTKSSDLFPTLWLIIHYFLFFVMFFVDCMEKRKNLILEEKILQKLLEEVSEIDLMGDPVAWRRIAFNVNQCFVKEKYNTSVFYSGEQCRRFFVKEVVIPVDSGSYDIKTCYNENMYTDFCKNPSNKKLAQKAIANYNKSVENYDELPHINGELECDNVLFEKFHTISVISILCLHYIELVLSMIMCIAIVALLIYRAIFN
ncbi:hypothetical protein BZL39_D00210 [Zygosaccharomyces parabailii]|nr:hypothetical protein BZL39_D00210 [Zygosaccharomyces parabailii]CDH16887.1 uncharacterized protein ZBAI_08675 [Zygosaccharomyces bailii ISA1307]